MHSLNKTIVITGSTSFVGMHLCQTFAKNSWRVIAGHTLDSIEYSNPQAARISQLSNLVKFEKFDICDKNALANIVDKYSPKIWIQHGGHAIDYASNNYDFERGLKVNAGSMPILFKALVNRACGVIVTGSEAEYGPSETAHVESDTSQPSSLYGIAKLTQTITAQQQSEFYGIPARVARLFLPFGSFDHPNKVISLVVKALKNNQPINLSSCTQKRDFIGISDVCNAYLKMADDMNRSGFDIFNICSGEATVLKTFLELIADNIGANHKLLKFGKILPREGEPHLLLGDRSKIKTILDWHPNALDQAIINEAICT